MKVVLTSSLGGTIKQDGKRYPAILLQENGLLGRIRSIWKENARVLLISGDPCNYEKNDVVCSCLREAFPMSGLSVSSMDVCDDRSRELALHIEEMDVLILMGGHVPTQNAFMKEITLKEHLADFTGIVIAWSAGSMNCAELVYAGPELEGEAIDPLYERWISGLGLTNINIFPHFQELKDECLDGLRVIEDITFADSMGHEFLALNDGSYIYIEDGRATLYGEAYRIMDAQINQICSNNESLVIKPER